MQVISLPKHVHHHEGRSYQTTLSHTHTHTLKLGSSILSSFTELRKELFSFLHCVLSGSDDSYADCCNNEEAQTLTSNIDNQH